MNTRLMFETKTTNLIIVNPAGEKTVMERNNTDTMVLEQVDVIRDLEGLYYLIPVLLKDAFYQDVHHKNDMRKWHPFLYAGESIKVYVQVDINNINMPINTEED